MSFDALARRLKADRTGRVDQNPPFPAIFEVSGPPAALLQACEAELRKEELRSEEEAYREKL